MDEEVKVIGTMRSPFVCRVIWALKLKGIEYEFVEEDIFNKSELLLKSNPVHKKIPVLIHRGNPVAESLVILEYIDETWPHTPLLPSDPHQRASARFWAKFGEDKSKEFFAFFRTVGEEQEKATMKAKELLKILEKQCLGESKFFGGENIGMVDIVFGWIAVLLPALEEAAGVKLLEPNYFPHLVAWIQNFRQNSAVRNTLQAQDTLVAINKYTWHCILETQPGCRPSQEEKIWGRPLF